MRGLRIPLLLTGVLAAAGAEAARVVDVRVGAHAEKTRIVLELDAPASYRVSPQDIPTAAGNVTELRLELDAAGSFALAGQPGLVDSVRIKPQAEGSVALIRLKTLNPIITDMALENPPRIVIDVARGTARPAASPPAAASPAAPPPVTPAPAAAPPAAERPADVIVGTAPPAREVGGPPTAVAARPTGPAPSEPEPPVVAAEPTAPEEPPAPAPAPADAAPAAGELAPAPEAPAGAAPAGESAAPEAPAPPPAVPPAPPLPARPAQEEPPAPEAEPSGGLGDLPRLVPALASDPRVVGAAAVVAVLFVLWLLVRGRTRSAGRRRRVEAFPPLPPLDGLAPEVDEHELVGPVREEPALTPPAEEDEFPAPKRAARISWREPLPGTSPERATPRAAEPPPPPTPAASAAPIAPEWSELPPPPESEFEPPDLWEESDLEPEAPSQAAAPAPSAEPTELELSPPPPPAAPSAELERELRELERRLRHLETRLEEVTEARDRMERQLAANAEELRVQRSAIARTQRVVRTLAQPDAPPREPARGPGS